MFPYNKFYFTGILTIVSTVTICAQNNSSPYSILGIGDIENSYFNRTTGMGNTGIAYRTSQSLINNNPAAYTALNRQIFVAEVAGRGSFINYSGKNITALNNSSSDFAVRRLAIGTKINNWWGSGMGVVPYSTSNYSFSGKKSIQGTADYIPAAYEGTGGLSQFYWTNGFDLVKNVSIGITSSAIWGNLSQKELLSDGLGNTILSTTTGAYLRNLNFSYGMQYKARFGKRWNAVIGATYTHQQKLNATYELTVTGDADTTLKNEILKTGSYSLPAGYGIGIDVVHNNKYHFLADYKAQAWGSLNYKGRNYSLQDSRLISAGFEYANMQTGWGREFEKYYLQAGAFYSESYLKIYGEQLKDYGLSAGYGRNIKHGAMSYGVALEYGKRGISSQQLIKEQYLNISINFIYKDFWFTRGRQYD